MVLLRELSLEIGLLRPAGAGTGRITALRHEAVDDAMERCAVVKPFAGQLLDALDVLGREIGPECHRHPALRQIDVKCVFRIARHCASFMSFMLTILSGLAGGSPRVIASTQSMPSVTSPNTVYCPLRKSPSANMMKNCELALLGSCDRAMPSVPRLKGSLENSAGMSGSFEPPMPVPVGSPVCAMNPSMTRWKIMPS